MTEPTPAPAVPPAPPTPVGRILMIVAGALIVLVAGAVVLAGAALTWAHATQRDDDGYFSTSSERLDTATPVIISDELDLGVSPDDTRWFDAGDLATVRIDVEGVGESPAFVGIGPAADVAAYLDGVAQAQIEDIEVDPFRVEYQFRDGADQADPPTDQDFWVAQGTDGEPLVWDLESGDWVVVVMNADGSAGVSVDAAVAAKVDWLLPLGIGLLIGGFVFLVGGALLVVFGAVGLSRHSAAHPAAVPAVGSTVSSSAPIRLTGHLDDGLSRWLWLVKWVLIIPHVIVLAVLWVGVGVVWIIAWFAIVFTGRYPRSLFGYTVGVMRWTWRVGFYSYAALGTDRYPPFSFEAQPDDPAGFDVDYPERLSRGLVWVKSWLLAIPHLIIIGILAGGGAGAWWGGRRVGPGLIGVLVVIAGVGLLFTSRYARSLFDLIVGLNRWVFRVLAYVLLLRDEYPPFRLDQGGTEPDG
ncbi:MAG TPA: DUF4389 domain-containing protein [Acidimicrobiales bacterium]|nr:DUF4389 domain-containing protein [Acidimicrobiales bacterium]